MRRLREPIVFLKLEVSRFLADSPIARCLGPNEIRELYQGMSGDKQVENQGVTYGVALLDTSFAITSIPLWRATPIL